MTTETTPGSASAPIAFLFPGQGSQSVGMGRELAAAFPIARQTFDEADEALGFSLSTLCFEGPEDQLRLTEFTQPAIFTVSLAVHRVLSEHGLRPSAVAGHSLGEWSANAAAGTVAFRDAVRIVRERGRLMQQAVPPGEGAMAAILALPSDAVSAACSQAHEEIKEPVSPANFNSPDQTVISGSLRAVTRAMELCKNAGARKVVQLPVSAPFHCGLMEPAEVGLATVLEGVTFSAPTVPLVANVDAALKTTAQECRDALIRQVTAPVRWVDCIQTLTRLAPPPALFLEVGPGKVLCGLLRQIDRALKSANVEDPASLSKLQDLLLVQA